MIRGAIFDVDGTLLDSMGMWITFGSSYLLSKGITPPEDIDEVIQYFSLRETAEYLADNYFLGTADSVESEMKKITEDFYFNKVQAKDGVSELLKSLKENGVKLFIATATYKELIIPALERLGLWELFEGIVTCPEVGVGKDKPLVFLKALETLGTKKEETFVFEDARHAIMTAKKSGFPVCCVFDETERQNREELEGLCDKYWESFAFHSYKDFN